MFGKKRIQVVINNKYENSGKTVKYKYRSIVANHNNAAFLEYWYNSSLFPRGQKGLTSYTMANYMLAME
jgi:hypothetical protein